MAKAYYSTVFDASAADVWQIVRDFNNYPVWVDGAGTSEIEGGKSGDTVGAIRNVLYQGRRVRQRLLAQSDVERTQVYEFVGPIYRPIIDFQATIRITPVVDRDRSFVEWWATFECEPAQRDEQIASLQTAFATWLGSLRRAVAGSRSAEISPDAVVSG
jgi:polyketide cyclase/dehydrase/lipid transport protein